MIPLSKLWAPKRPEPSYPRLPAVDSHSETTLRGVYAVGEIAGTPLIKYGLNAGHEIVTELAQKLAASQGLSLGHGQDAGKASNGEMLDFVIIGAGASGIAAAAQAKKLGLRAVVLEANHLAETVYTMTKGKLIFAEPEGVENKSHMWFEECRKEELLERWADQVETLGLDIRTFEKVEDIKRVGKQDSYLEVTSNKGNYRAHYVILAAGKAGNPRKAGVEGEVEFAAKIDHRLIDPDLFRGRDILIYGGGDVALEGALSLCEHNRVTLATIDPEFIYPKKRNIDAVLEKVKEGRIELLFNTFLSGVAADSVTLSVGGPKGEKRTLPNDHVFEMIGAELPFAFFKRVGIQLENTWSPKRWIALFLAFIGVYSLYALKSYGKGASGWPFQHFIGPESYDKGLQNLFEAAFLPFRGLFTPEAYRDIMADRGYQQGYLYSLLYTVVMIVFGGMALMRWRSIARRKRYQTWRYATLIGFQLVFFLGVNIIAVQALSVQYAWRAWGLYQPFPLFFNVFFWWYDGDPTNIKWFFITAGLLGTFVAMPLLARYHGKRFCTWICGCGGLAETLGDRWRHLSAKGERSRLWQFQGMLILLASALVALIVVGLFETDGNNVWWRSYSYLVDFWLVAVIPVALYPFFGGKVWCRYWCPLAAWNQVLSKWFGKLGIKSNEHCISCTQCSKYCQVGVDVMAFAKNQVRFDNRNSACIHCGICIDVCPMDVLAFDSSGADTKSADLASPA